MAVAPPPPGLFDEEETSLVSAPPPGLFQVPEPPAGLFSLPAPVEEPGVLSGLGGFAYGVPKDIVASIFAGIPGLVLEGANIYRESQRKVAEEITGKQLELTPVDIHSRRAASYLLGVANDAFEDVTDAQADLALANSKATGLPLEVTVTGTSGVYTAAQFVSPGKYIRGVLGITGIAAASVYGGAKLLGKLSEATGIRKLFRGATKVAERAAAIGDLPDPLRSLSHAEEVAEESARLAAQVTPAEIAAKARQQALTESQFPFAPTGAVSGAPDEVVQAARQELSTLKDFPGLPSSSRATRGVEQAAESYVEKIRVGQVDEALKDLKGKQVAAERRARAVADPVARKVEQETADAYREIGMSVRDANVAGRLQNTVLPTDVPELVLTNPAEAAKNLGRQYVYRREYGYVVANERERVLKEVLSSGNSKADKALREDLTFYIQRTGNPTVELSDTADDVLARIRSHPRGVTALALTDSIRTLQDDLYRELSELNVKVGDKEINYVDNYLRQIWKPEKVGGFRGKGGVGGSRGLLESGLFRGRENLGQARARVRGRFEELRKLPNYRKGIEVGLEPRTLDVAEILHITERQYGEVMALKKMLADLGELNSMPDGSPVYFRGVDPPKGVSGKSYVQADIPYVGRFVEGSGPLHVHRDVYKPMRNIIEGIAKNEGNWIDDLSVLNKRSNFAFTMFHGYSLGENAILSLGPMKGARVLGSVAAAGGGIPLAEQLKRVPGVRNLSFVERIGGARAFDHLTSTGSMRESTIRGLKYNLVVETPRVDLMRNVWERAAGNAVEALQKKGPVSRAAGKGLEFLTWAQKSFDAALWERMHAPLKVIVFDELYETVLRAKRGGRGFKAGGLAGRFKGKALQNLSDDEIGYRVAAYVNDEFGGQSWETLNGRLMQFFARPKNLQKLRRYWISPDWNISSFRANLGLFSLVGGDPVRGVLGARHWRNAFLGLAAATHTMNYMLTKAFDGEGKFAFENEPGKDGMFGGLMPTYVDTGGRDENGRRIHVRVMKQIQEVPEFIESPMDFVGRKMIPWSQTIMNMFAKEKDPFSYVGKAVQQAREEGIELDNIDYFLLYGADMGEAFSPFGSTFNPLREAPPLGRGSDLLLPLPQSLGGSRGRLQRKFQKAIKDGDWEMQQRIIEALRDNGYTPGDITTILNTATTMAYKQEAN